LSGKNHSAGKNHHGLRNRLSAFAGDWNYAYRPSQGPVAYYLPHNDYMNILWADMHVTPMDWNVILKGKGGKLDFYYDPKDK
jgi:prepilin-type processing-associated H-X9-DG protein